MGTNNLVFLEVIEWFDETGKELVHRIPEQGSGEIKYGAQLIVRESQAAVFFYKGKACDAFGPGRHTLKTANIPVLTKILAIPWGMTSPLRAEAYLVNMKVFPNLKWGTRDPVAFKDSELGLVRLRVKKASVDLTTIFDTIDKKAEDERTRGAVGIDSPFAEITDEDIDSLFGDV